MRKIVIHTPQYSTGSVYVSYEVIEDTSSISGGSFNIPIDVFSHLSMQEQIKMNSMYYLNPLLAASVPQLDEVHSHEIFFAL
jgi:hypothetical protein